MPIIIPDKLPAVQTFNKEHIFVLHHKEAIRQDIRPLKIAILNLMPDKITTETQLLRLLGNTPIQIDITLLHPKTYESKHTHKDHLVAFYKHFDDIKNEKFDGLIITGAPVEQLPFEKVNYWDELTQVMEWSKHHVTSTFHICWGAQAGLYYHYHIQKYPLAKKMFGSFAHTVAVPHTRILRGFDDTFFVPHSRHTEVRKSDILKVPELEILAESIDAGIHLVASRDRKQFFATGHAEYDPHTLKKEYERDRNLGFQIDVPVNYFPHNDPKKEPIDNWRSHANLIFSNWLNYYVYQETPYDVRKVK